MNNSIVVSHWHPFNRDALGRSNLMAILALVISAIVSQSGCSNSATKKNVDGQVPYSTELAPLIGSWTSNGRIVLIVEKRNNSVIIQEPKNDKIRYEISGANVSGNTIMYTQRHYLRTDESNIFSQMVFDCTIQPVDGEPNHLRWSLSTKLTPEPEVEVLDRLK